MSSNRNFFQGAGTDEATLTEGSFCCSMRYQETIRVPIYKTMTNGKGNCVNDQRVKKLAAIPKPEKIKETELIDTPTVLPHAGWSSSCKFLLIRISFLTYLYITVVGMHFYKFKNQHMISNLQRKESKRNSF